jgi:hypothetical protein
MKQWSRAHTSLPIAYYLYGLAEPIWRESGWRDLDEGCARMHPLRGAYAASVYEWSVYEWARARKKTKKDLILKTLVEIMRG